MLNPRQQLICQPLSPGTRRTNMPAKLQHTVANSTMMIPALKDCCFMV